MMCSPSNSLRFMRATAHHAANEPLATATRAMLTGHIDLCMSIPGHHGAGLGTLTALAKPQARPCSNEVCSILYVTAAAREHSTT